MGAGLLALVLVLGAAAGPARAAPDRAGEGAGLAAITAPAATAAAPEAPPPAAPRLLEAPAVLPADAPLADAPLADAPLAAPSLAAPPLVLDRLDGGTADLAAAGGTAVIHFFATWCAPCRTELPALARFAARHPHLPVLLVNVAEPDARVRRFFSHGGAPGAVLLDRDRAAAQAWGVSLLPATFVVMDGRIRLVAEGEVAWDAPQNDSRIGRWRAAAQPDHRIIGEEQ
ncbi:TlpA family protein disulfide reductase [Xanthobacter sp. AM11]|uniref:TlpA family protein disulfide reductase n=1 Tax=Xanthobacter sp. AM11 TaxID=3380643 RepID=UPI0039BF2E67